MIGTAIETGKYWDRAWSLVEGCTKVSPGCDHCWLQGMNHRFHREGPVTFRADRLELPLHVKKPTTWAIWSDLFHESVDWNDIYKTYIIMASCPQHTFMVLTKRPERAAKVLPDVVFHLSRNGLSMPTNVYLGVTAENQEQADKRIPLLLQTPAAHRFLSIEPLLSPIDLTASYPDDYYHCTSCGHHGIDSVQRECINCGGRSENPDNGNCSVCDTGTMAEICPECEGNDYKTSNAYALVGSFVKEYRMLPGIDWVIVGCETGPKRRPCNLEWIRAIRDQCKAAGVPLWVKGIEAPRMCGAYIGGTFLQHTNAIGPVHVSHDMAEWPEDLRIRQMPEGLR